MSEQSKVGARWVVSKAAGRLLVSGVPVEIVEQGLRPLFDLIDSGELRLDLKEAPPARVIPQPFLHQCVEMAREVVEVV